ncbi:class E sortase [Streptomyces sp. NPDC014733]|uniref:class E sortase n=1 Tax=Streptomyces sp. NPDC014733 TaxID=3364885 RepID=UPI00370359ED
MQGSWERAVAVRGRRRAPGRAVRALAETAVTCGAVLLLLVVHQLWWTNRQAHEAAQDRVGQLERRWARPQRPPAAPPAPDGPAPSGHAPTTGPAPRPRAPAARPAPPRPAADGYAVLRIPRLGLAVPVAEGIGRTAVLDKGYVGHYPGTAQPGGSGNAALAGHRNTHGEPFRHLDRMRVGDTVRVDTADAVLTYVVRAVLPRTTPGDTGVLAPVPRSTVHPAYGFTAPGAYLTLTTCTPEFTSTYRLIVWAELRSSGPR